MQAYKGRTLKRATTEVYRNLHNNKFSLRQGGLVRGHAGAVFLTEAVFIVRESGRQKVLRERSKNVHAWVMGNVLETMSEAPEGLQSRYQLHEWNGWKEAYYNPYKVDSFIDRKTGRRLAGADVVAITPEGIFYRGAE